MMMPANFSVIAENEMTYVYGGAGLADWLPDAMSVKTLTTNLVNIVANSFVGKLVENTLGVMFGGNYFVNGNTVWNSLGNMFTGNGTYNGLNIAMQVLGGAAAVYQLASV
ncbi:MAG: hypothetical protein ACI4LE_06975, partial [Faecalibacterium sp.]